MDPATNVPAWKKNALLFLEQDVDRLKNYLIVTTAYGNNWLWYHVLKDLKKKILNGARVCFIAHPQLFEETSHSAINELCDTGAQLFHTEVWFPTELAIEMRYRDRDHLFASPLRPDPQTEAMEVLKSLRDGAPIADRCFAQEKISECWERSSIHRNGGHSVDFLQEIIESEWEWKKPRRRWF